MAVGKEEKNKKRQKYQLTLILLSLLFWSSLGGNAGNGSSTEGDGQDSHDMIWIR
jgi:hypothetical protein